MTNQKALFFTGENITTGECEMSTASAVSMMEARVIELEPLVREFMSLKSALMYLKNQGTDKENEMKPSSPAQVSYGTGLERKLYGSVRSDWLNMSMTEAWHKINDLKTLDEESKAAKHIGLTEDPFKYII